MESKAVKLAKKIFTVLKDQEYHDSVDALKIAKIMLPTPSARKSKLKEESDQQESDGALVPADQDLMRFSQAMTREARPEAETPETEMS